MDTLMNALTDLKMMAAMRIATDGRTVARVTAELPLAQVKGEYLAGFAYSLGPIERERVAREIDRDLRDNGQTRSYVVCEATSEHRDLLLSYEVLYYNDSAKVSFTLTSAAPRQLQPRVAEALHEMTRKDQTP